jgi:hypothetical protein
MYFPYLYENRTVKPDEVVVTKGDVWEHDWGGK